MLFQRKSNKPIFGPSSAELRREEAERRRLEEIRVAKVGASAFLHDMPYGVMLNFFLRTIEARGDKTAPATHQFANEVSRLADRQDREAGCAPAPNHPSQSATNVRAAE